MVQLIVEYDADKNELAKELMCRFGKLKYHLPLINSFVIELPEDVATDVLNLEGVRAVYQNAHITAQMKNALEAVSGETLQGLTGNGIGIAILDTGVAPVDDLSKPRNRVVAFKDFVNGKVVAYDDNGHGTHVRG